MPTTRKPRAGSMAFWPRKRARRHFARVRSWPLFKQGPLGFAGYKAGMVHAIVLDSSPHSMTKDQEIFCPVTVLECPPIKVFGIRFYKKDVYGNKVIGEKTVKPDKELARKIVLAKKTKEKVPQDYDEVRLLIYTQPRLTGIGKKKPDLFEIAIAGSKEEQLKYAEEKLGKEIFLKDVFAPGQQVDVKAITKGKGFQGPVKRFGIGLRSHKSEKGRRGPGNVGPWTGAKMWRVAHAGQMGYHQRTDYNKFIITISEKPEEVNPKGGFKRYGLVKNPCLLLKGTVPGPAKRMIRIDHALRPTKKLNIEAPQIQLISR